MQNEVAPLTVERGFLITIVSGVVFAGIGSLLGYGIGTFAPEYYRIVFRIPSDVPLSTQRLGLALGATQGVIAGLGVGLVIVVAVAWCAVRSAGRVR